MDAAGGVALRICAVEEGRALRRRQLERWGRCAHQRAFNIVLVNVDMVWLDAFLLDARGRNVDQVAKLADVLLAHGYPAARASDPA